MDTDVLVYASPTPQVEVQDHAAVFFPATLPATPSPLIVLLHGNHSTCGSNTTPIVQDRFPIHLSREPVQPGRRFRTPGLHLSRHELASWGYIVDSIDANMGITCGNGTSQDSGLVLARGRMVLRHLQLLSSWNKNAGTTPSSLGVDLAGHIDFSNVGLFGHSRGGEGIRAAYNLYKSDPNVGVPWTTQILSAVTFKGMFEVGPVDGQSDMTLNANGTAWNVLLPGCDGDVVALQGMKPYDRMLQDTTESPAEPKSMVEVWGANHDFYNSYWQNSDSTGCVGTTPLWSINASSSENEQETAIASVIPFFRAHVGATADPTLAVSFDPSYPILPEVAAITRVDRTYTATSNNLDTTHVENFSTDSTNGSMGHPFGVNNVTLTVGTVPEHSSTLMAGEIIWTSSGADTYFQDNWTATPEGLNVAGNTSLNFRVSRNNSSSNPSAATDFSVNLVFADGSLGTTVDLADYFDLLGPIGSSGSLLDDSDTPDYHETLSTVRIPLSALGAIGKQVSGVRFTFAGTSTGDIFISSIDLATNPIGSGGLETSSGYTGSGSDGANAVKLQNSQASQQGAQVQNAVKPINHLGRVQRANDSSGDVIIEVQSDTSFPVRDALTVLRLNGKNVAVATIDLSGDLHSLTFRVKSDEISALSDEVKLDVGYKEDPNGPVRSVGFVPKSSLQP